MRQCRSGSVRLSHRQQETRVGDQRPLAAAVVESESLVATVETAFRDQHPDIVARRGSEVQRQHKLGDEQFVE